MYKIQNNIITKRGKSYPLTKKSVIYSTENSITEIPDDRVTLIKRMREPTLNEECSIHKIPVRHFVAVSPIYNKLKGKLTKIEKGKYEVTLTNTGVEGLVMRLNRLDFCLDDNFVIFAHIK